jgi:hypothetical protein
MTGRLFNIQTVHASGPFVGSDPLPGPLQVLSRQHRFEQR